MNVSDYYGYGFWIAYAVAHKETWRQWKIAIANDMAYDLTVNKERRRGS